MAGTIIFVGICLFVLVAILVVFSNEDEKEKKYQIRHFLVALPIFACMIVLLVFGLVQKGII